MNTTSKSSSEFDTRWGVAAPVARPLFEEVASRLIPQKRWAVLEGRDGFSALLVGDGDVDPQLAAAFMARNDAVVYLLDFDDESPAVIELDQGKKKKRKGHPAAFLQDHGIVAPGYEPPPESPVRSVIVIDGAAPKAAMKLGFDAFTHAQHSRGTLVTGRVLGSEKDYVKKLGGPIYTLTYNNATGAFWCTIEERGKPSRWCGPETPLSKYYERVPDIFGETTLEGVCKVLDVPPDLLRDRHP